MVPRDLFLRPARCGLSVPILTELSGSLSRCSYQSFTIRRSLTLLLVSMARGGGSFLLIRAISNQRKFSARASLDLREAFPRWLLRQHVTPISPRLFWGPISATPNSEFFCSRARRHLLVPYWRSIKECRQDDVHICPSHCCSWAVQACDVHEGASRSKWALNSYRPSRMRPTYFSSPHDRSLLILTRGDFFPFTLSKTKIASIFSGPFS